MIHTISQSLISALPSFLLVGCAVTLFQLATLIIGGYIEADFLGGFYKTFPEWWQRMLIVIIPLSGIGNLFAAQAYANPTVAGVSFIVFGNWSALVAASIINKTDYQWPEFLLVFMISLLALWLAIRISQ